LSPGGCVTVKIEFITGKMAATFKLSKTAKPSPDKIVQPTSTRWFRINRERNLALGKTLFIESTLVDIGSMF
jgi:hypothetical protein